MHERAEAVEDILDRGRPGRPDVALGGTRDGVLFQPTILIGVEASMRVGLNSRIHRKGHRDKPLSEREKRGNKARSKVRARVEHVFGAQSNDMGGTLVRSIGLVRARARIGLKNLAYNMRRLVQLERRHGRERPQRDGHQGRSLPGAPIDRETDPPGSRRRPKTQTPSPLMTRENRATCRVSRQSHYFSRCPQV